jgi:hypothetical protein
VCFTDEAVLAWRAEARTTPGGQPHYSALAITAGLMLRTVFGLTLRQTEIQLGLDLAVWAKTLEVPSLQRAATGPLHLLVDSTGLKLGGAGEWHGGCRASSRRCGHRAATGRRGYECHGRDHPDTARPSPAIDRRTRPFGVTLLHGSSCRRLG